jgi:DNA primase
MITDDTIQKVFDAAQLEQVIGEYIELRISGSNLKGLSPFNSEKTPSFMVSPSKQIWKCFSSGKGGNSAVGFLMEYQNLTYPEAIMQLANKYSIEVVFDNQPEQSEEQKNLEQRCAQALHFAQNAYLKHLKLGTQDQSPALIYLNQTRKFTEDTIIKWQLGFAPDVWGTIERTLSDKGYFKEGEALGLIKTSKNKTNDFFWNRLIFPIHNHRGELVAFGGRDLSGKDGTAKYLNSPESKLYIKRKVLFGLNRALQSIKKEGFVYLTEGYTDVISMHQAGLPNTVATCGTSLSQEHIILLKRCTKHVVLLRDGDDAGLAAAARDTKLLLKHDFRIEICNLPKGEDPDSICREMNIENLIKN